MQTNDVNNIIVKHYAGSIAYGTNLPSSDTDIRGIFCAEDFNIRTPYYPVSEVTLEDEEDGKLYELSKFIKLYTDGNPNILETLWVDDRHILETSEVFNHLVEYREDLLSSKIAFTFSGYAMSQLKRIKGHDKWLNNPQPKMPPLHGNYLKLVRNFTSEKVFSRDFTKNYNNFLKHNQIVHYGDNIFGVVSRGGVASICSSGDFNISAKQIETDAEGEPPMYIIKYLQNEYKQDLEKHKNYWTWVDNRNKVRHELEANFGYDTKHAMHLVRLLRMAEEILKGEGVKVLRPDAQELLEIRAGSMSYEDLLSYAESKDQFIRGSLYKHTNLRKTPDIKLASKVLMECQDMIWGCNDK